MSFIADFQRLLLASPRFSVKHVMAENSDYADTVLKSKNCYYSFCVFYCEDVYYARYSRKCSSCNGITFCVECEWCTECVDCQKCYSCHYAQDCQNCSNCLFCKDCFGCRNCFGSSSLHQKEYHMFNEKLSREEYEKRMHELNLKDFSQRMLVEERVNDLRRKTPNLAIHQFMTEGCVGDHLTQCKNSYQCFDSFLNEDCAYCIETNGNKNCMDLTVCFENEWCAHCVQSTMNHGCDHVIFTDQSNDCAFSSYLRNCKHCFGCASFDRKEYHILNTPVAPERYEEEVAKLRRELSEAGLHNLNLFFVSDYEHNRLRTEMDPAIASTVPPL
ncbi:MAG: hypothetical protein PHH13_05155 [Candidatus Peribacteraceae bacterium]|nr:hypothetical protein [Candidatus Peribacteraceae bacterium]